MEFVEIARFCIEITGRRKVAEQVYGREVLVEVGRGAACTSTSIPIRWLGIQECDWRQARLHAITTVVGTPWAHLNGNFTGI